MKLVYPVLGILIAITSIGGFFMLVSIGYNASGSIIIDPSKAMQFSSGLATFLVGLVGLSFVARFYAVFGKYSIFRPHI